MKREALKENKAEQGSLEWRLARLGKVTSTRVADIMGKGKAKDQLFSATAISTIADIAGERDLNSVTKGNEESFMVWSDLQCIENSAMRHGKDYEDRARASYCFAFGREVETCGLIDHPSVPYLAGSPDGLVLSRGSVRGVVEIKCPSTTKTFTRFRWFVKDGETLKAENAGYYWQCQNNMNVTGAKWCDFIVFCPFTKHDMHVVRIERNDDDIALINERVKLVNDYIDEMEK